MLYTCYCFHYPFLHTSEMLSPTQSCFYVHTHSAMYVCTIRDDCMCMYRVVHSVCSSYIVIWFINCIIIIVQNFLCKIIIIVCW